MKNTDELSTGGWCALGRGGVQSGLGADESTEAGRAVHGVETVASRCVKGQKRKVGPCTPC